MTRYLGLAEFFWLAEQVTGLDTTTLVKASRVDLADSALHAPQAGYGDEDFYPDLYDKAAVLTCRLPGRYRVCVATSPPRCHRREAGRPLTSAAVRPLGRRS